MSTRAQRVSDEDRCRQSHVLVSRPLRPDHDPESLSHFDDMRWNLTPAIFEPHQAPLSVNFERFPEHWRSSAKVYFWLLLNDDVAPRLPRTGFQRANSVRTVATNYTHLLWLVRWAIDRGFDSLEDFSETTLDEVLRSIIDSPSSSNAKLDRLQSIRRLWAARDYVPARLKLRARVLWDGEDSKDLLPRMRARGENRTPRISSETMEPLLGWAVRFVDDFAGDICAAISEYMDLQMASRTRRARGVPKRSVGGRRERLAEVLLRLKANNLGIPGRVGLESENEIRWSHLARLTESSASAHTRFDMDLIESSGLSVDDDAYLFSRFTEMVDGQPFKQTPIRFDEVPTLWRHLTTACFIVVSYLSGMRPGEVLSLERGAARYDSAGDTWLVTGRHWKGARDASGAKIPEGEIRRDPWVVHETAARAIKLLETLTDGTLIFPSVTGDIRSGLRYAARTTGMMAGDIKTFTSWINSQCAASGRTDFIPDDANGSLTLGRFRRTLAWHIVRRPRGLVAAGIQYGHLELKVTQGYAGDSSSGFPDELAFERWLEEIDSVADSARYLADGGAVSGPAAREYARRVGDAQKRFEGRMLPTARQAQRLLDSEGSQIYPGRGLHCVFDKEKALCARSKPDMPVIDGCRPACQNIARTDQDIADVRLERERLSSIESDDLAPPIRYHRVNLLTAQLDGIIHSHDEAKGSMHGPT